LPEGFVPLPIPVIVALYAVIWIGIHIGAGYLAHRLPLRLFARGGVLCRARRWERDGTVYRKVLVHRWKDAIPEAGSFFTGGFSKRALTGRDPDYLRRFIAETCRAEFSHWLAAVAGATFFFWNPWYVGVIMLGYGVATNLPFAVVQRYNRARFRRFLDRHAG
jgi:glycosyl-4,4'-diaponeurosporenoate acyltransferase